MAMMSASIPQCRLKVNRCRGRAPPTNSVQRALHLGGCRLSRAYTHTNTNTNNTITHTSVVPTPHPRCVYCNFPRCPADDFSVSGSPAREAQHSDEARTHTPALLVNQNASSAWSSWGGPPHQVSATSKNVRPGKRRRQSRARALREAAASAVTGHAGRRA